MSKGPVFILGCGWLGFPLALRLKELGFEVRGSSTSIETVRDCESQGIHATKLTLSPQFDQVLPDSFRSSKILVITLPFKRSFLEPSYYLEQLKSIIKELPSTNIEWVIFTSSTMIYPTKNKIVTEDTPIEPTQERQAILNEIENFLLLHPRFITSILRLGGLYGPSRDIGHFLSGEQLQKSGDTPVNLVHQDDAVEIMAQLIDRNIQDDIVNIVSDEHPTRQELYSIKAEKLDMKPPKFLDTGTPYKLVDNKKVKSLLNYQFKYEDPKTCL